MKLSPMALGLLTFAACSTLHAQGGDLKATIPFEFRLGQKVMPAGDYTILHRVDGVITVREDGGNHMTQTFITLPAERHEKRESGSLVFNRYGNIYFLSKVWSPDSYSGRAFPTSRQEKELASQIGPNHPAGVTLALK